MAILKTLKQGFAAATIALGLATTAQAATLASASYSGDFTVSNDVQAEAFAFTLDGAFNAAIDPNVLMSLTPSTVLTFSADISGDAGQLGTFSFTPSIQATVSEVESFLTNLASNPVVTDLVAYIFGNTQSDYAFLGGTLTTFADNVTFSGPTVAGDFDVTYENNSFALSSLPSFAADGTFVANFNIDAAMPAVPLPASLPLLLAGFGGFAMLRRRGR